MKPTRSHLKRKISEERPWCFHYYLAPSTFYLPRGCYNFHVENKRANDAGLSSLWRPFAGITRSPIVITAALFVLIFLVAVGWRANKTIETTNSNSSAGTGRVSFFQNQYGYGAGTDTVGAPARAYATSSDPNDFSQTQYDVFGELLGTYVALKKTGAYTEEKGADIANRIAEATVAPVSYTAVAKSGIKTDPDISYNRMLLYRSDLQVALAPLLLNTESELGIFNDYVQTRDKHYLQILGEVAGRYHKTVGLLPAVTVPQDALDYHLGITNSLLAFATTLDAMIKNADDPMATLALLRTYNTAEDNVYTSFNSLASYEKRKIP